MEATELFDIPPDAGSKLPKVNIRLIVKSNRRGVDVGTEVRGHWNHQLAAWITNRGPFFRWEAAPLF